MFREPKETMLQVLKKGKVQGTKQKSSLEGLNTQSGLIEERISRSLEIINLKNIEKYR